MGDESLTSIFFALRSSVELFEDPMSPSAATRAKEAACLYDHLVFEPGLLEVTIASNGCMPWWFPKEHLTPERRAIARRPVPAGAPVSISMGVQRRPGEPAPPEAMHAVSLGEVNVHYVAEFYTGILDELSEFKLDWVREAGGGSIDRTHPEGLRVAQEIDDLVREERWAKSPMPRSDSFLQGYVTDSFYRDAVLAKELGAAFNITPLFAPMMARHAVLPDLSGSAAFRYAVPKIGCLPWEAVIEFREHEAAQEARTKLREFERRASEDARDACEFFEKAGQAVTAALFDALKDQRTSLPEELAKEALLGAVELIPGIGPVAGKSAAVVSAVREHQKARRHWTTALMRLRAHG
ncbi:MAG TPA: hypothetical protein VGO48_17885 [Conexibacter sp.]|jgi:hypothetical protein|nr:hypothetical protein [Conexibacter sp.]